MNDWIKDPKFQAMYEQLKKVRESKTVELRPTPMLKKEIVGFDGKLQPFNLRYYQVQGIFHLLSVNRMVLGDGTGTGKCKSSKSLVLTDRGLVPLGSFVPTDRDLQEDTFYPLAEPTKVWDGGKWSSVKSFYWSGKKPSKVVKTSRGYKTDGSIVHPILARTLAGNLFVQMGALQKDDWLAIDRSITDFPSTEPSISFTPSTNRPFTYPTKLTPSLAALLGWIVGEAWVMSPYYTKITQWPGEGHDEIRRLMKEVFNWSGNEENKNGATSIEVSSVDIRAYLHQCGIEFQKSAGKSVPPIILQATLESAKSFLVSLFEAEASVCREGGVEISSASQDLINGVHKLLLRFGIVSSTNSKWNKKYQRFYYRLTFSGDDARLFQDRIGFLSASKAGLLKSVLDRPANTNKDVVPHCKLPVQALRKAIVASSKAYAKLQGIHNSGGWGLLAVSSSFQSTFKHVVSGKRNATYPFLKTLLREAERWNLTRMPEYQEISTLVEKNFFYDRVTEVLDTEDELMDIEVDDPSHSFVADGFINHNTIQAIGAMCYLWERNPNMKIMVVCPKSAIRQWYSEVGRFTTGVKAFMALGSPSAREKSYREWFEHQGPSILAMNYHSMVKDWDYGIKKEAPEPSAKKGTQPKLGQGLLDGLTSNAGDLLVVFDEASAFKNPSTKTHQTAKFLSDKAKRVWGLTATLLKNRLEEGFGIYKVIRPQTFTSKTRFLDDYCQVEMQRARGGIRVPIVIGYKNLAQFRAVIDPFFYGRAKHQISSELPALTTREVLCELSPAEDRKYAEALQGVMLMGDGNLKDYQETKDLTALIYCQQVCNSLGMLKFEAGSDVEGLTFEGKSAKETALMEILTEEYADEKVIVYTRFASIVDRIQKFLAQEKIKSVRITGSENDKARRKAQEAFQDMSSPVKVVIITDAASEAINLQAAQATIFFDTPWSWGNYVQIIGRMVRIGSPHPNVNVVHLMAERPNQTGKKRETIDHKVIAKLRSKKGLIDQIIGEAAQGALRFERSGNDIGELLKSVKESV
jgi:hypothetical protein